MKRVGWGVGWLVAVVLATGCASKAPETLVRADARAPISSSLTALSPQAREAPWANQTLRASAPFELAGANGLPAPISASEARIAARQAALSELARQLSRLPAAEPPPGESVQSNIADFAARQPQFAQRVQEELLAAQESVRLVPEEGRGQVELALPLARLAEDLLKSGGGYRKGDQLAEAIGPRGIAARQATTEAEEKLLLAVLETKIDEKLTVGEWLRSEPANRRVLLEAFAKKKTIIGEARPRTDGTEGEEFVVEFEVDVTTLLDVARGAEKARARVKEMENK